jgi:hypothetical protein
MEGPVRNIAKLKFQLILDCDKKNDTGIHTSTPCWNKTLTAIGQHLHMLVEQLFFFENMQSYYITA